MTDLNATFGLEVALLLAFFAFAVWAWWSRSADPPRFRPYAVRQGWKVDPIALLDQDLRRGRLLWAVTLVHDRLVHELTGRFGLTPEEIVGPPGPGGPARRPEVLVACQTVVALQKTYELAYRAEDPERTDVWSEWRKPAWRQAARHRFESELAQVVALWPEREVST